MLGPLQTRKAGAAPVRQSRYFSSSFLPSRGHGDYDGPNYDGPNRRILSQLPVFGGRNGVPGPRC